MAKIGVVLDTTELFGDFYLTSPAFRLLFNALQKNLISTVLMPSIVCDETVNHFREHLSEQRDKLQSAIKRINQATKKNVHLQNEIKIEDEVKAYEAVLKAQIKREGIRVAEYPKTDHQKIVQKALLRKKPFDGEGKKGYRDALIWESVKSFLAENKDVDVVLITNNSKDFNSGQGEVHEDLLQDLDESKISRSSIRILKDLEEFNKAYLVDKLKSLEEMEKTLQTGMYKDLNLSKALSSLMESELKNKAIEYAIGDIYSEPEIDWMEDIDSIKIRTVKELDEEEVFVQAEIKAQCGLEFFMYKSDYYSLASIESIHVLDFDWNDHVLWGAEKRKINADISFTLTKKSQEITSFDITDLSFD